MEEKIRDLLREILPERCGVDQIQPGEELRSHGLNSMKKLELIVKLEEKFHISIDTKDLKNENFKSISSIRRLLEHYADSCERR